MAYFHEGDFGPVLTSRHSTSKSIDRQRHDSSVGDIRLYTRIDERVEHITSRLNVGLLRCRDQIGAVVGSQPFEGEGMSEQVESWRPYYVSRFKKAPLPEHKLVQGLY